MKSGIDGPILHPSILLPALLLIACASAPAVEPQGSTVILAAPGPVAAGPTAPTIASIAAAAEPAPERPKPPARPGDIQLGVASAMKLDGDLSDKQLVSEAKRQLGALSRCAKLVREGDPIVGSLNLQVTVAKDGAVVPDLQSPVSPEAKRCILEAVRAWSVKGAGSGRAMVLLMLED